MSEATWSQRFGGLTLVLVCVVLSTGAQLLLKLGMSLAAGSGITPAEFLSIDGWFGHSAMLTFLIGGFGCYGLSMLVWIRALYAVELSVAYPMLSLSYVFVYLIATQWPRLAEPVSLLRSAGIGLIVFGVIVVMSSARYEHRSNGQRG